MSEVRQPVRAGTISIPSRAESPTSSAAVGMIYLLCFLSGFAALFYELTWAKMLALTFGSTTMAAGTVIASFMGGMGLGAWSYHHLYNRTPRPLHIYAGLELGIAGSTALLTLGFYSLPHLFAGISRSIESQVALGLLRFAVIFLLLLPPSALMGATFPALCTVMIRTPQAVDRHLGMIYGINTVGAAAGALLAGFLFIAWIGLRGTVAVANLINVSVACAALALTATSLGRPGITPPVRQETAIPTDLPRWVTGTVLFVSGFTTLSYEIVWFRTSRYLFGGSTYALTVVLFTFLAGLGLGSLPLRRIVQRSSAEPGLALCQTGIAVFAMAAACIQSVLLTTTVLRDAISIFSAAVRAYPWWWRLLVQSGVCVGVMLPATLLMGLSFPLASRLFLGDVRRIGARVGGAYLLANMGSILGSVLGAVLLLPQCGTIGATKLLAAVNLSLGLLVCCVIRRVRTVLPFVATASVVIIVLGAALPRSHTLLGESFDGAPRRVLYTAEGDFATVQVFENIADPQKRAMAIDGYRIGFGSGFRRFELYRKQLLLAHLPMVLDTRIRSTLNVGLGSASTLHALASYADVERLDCVEINASVVQAARFFEESAVLSDPRVRVVVDDAVHYLLRSDDIYDLVISDGKQQITYAGNAALLSREFYRCALDRLSQHGLFVEWHPMTSLPRDLRINLRTICDVFPHVNVFYFASESALFVGSREPLFPRPHMTAAQFERSRAKADLEPYYIDHPRAFLSHWVAGMPHLRKLVDNDPSNTWDRLTLEFSAFKGSSEDWKRATFENVAFVLNAVTLRGPLSGAALQAITNDYAESAQLLRRCFAEYFSGRLGQAQTSAAQALAANPADREAAAVSEFIRNEISAATAAPP